MIEEGGRIVIITTETGDVVSLLEVIKIKHFEYCNTITSSMASAIN